MAKRFWRVRGYKQFELIYDVTIPIGCITESKIKELLRCLAAKDGLDYREIVGAYVKRKTKLANEHLNLGKYGPYPEYTCGEFPHFVAIVVDEDGNRIKYHL